MRFLFFTIVLLISSSTLFAQSNTVINRNQDRNSCSDYLRLKTEVDEVYARILDDYAKDYKFIVKFKQAQNVWANYREAQLEAIFPEADKSEYGASYPTCRCNWLVEFTNARLDFLIKFIANMNEQSCNGVMSSKKRKSFVKYDIR